MSVCVNKSVTRLPEGTAADRLPILLVEHPNLLARVYVPQNGAPVDGGRGQHTALRVVIIRDNVQEWVSNRPYIIIRPFSLSTVRLLSRTAVAIVTWGDTRTHVTAYLCAISGENSASTNPSPTTHIQTRTDLSLEEEDSLNYRGSRFYTSSISCIPGSRH